MWSADYGRSTDFEYELQMSQTNHKLQPEVETMFLVDQPRILLSQFFDYGQRELRRLGERSHSLCRKLWLQTLEAEDEKRRV